MLECRARRSPTRSTVCSVVVSRASSSRSRHQRSLCRHGLCQVRHGHLVSTCTITVLGLCSDSSVCLDHNATLTTTLEQGSDSTKVTWRLSGVPLGMEEEITRNLQGY